MTRAERIERNTARDRRHQIIRNFVAKHAQKSGAGRHAYNRRKETRDLSRLITD